MLVSPLLAIAPDTRRVSPSISVSFCSTGMLIEVFWLVVAVSFTATGASLTLLTVTVAWAVAVSLLGSLMV